MPKDETATLADWSARPLNNYLVKYAAADSYYALKIFYKFYKMVCFKKSLIKNSMTNANVLINFLIVI